MTDERIKEEYVYEYWDCPRCGNKGVRGDFRVCAQCGFTRDDTIKFYRKEIDELVTDEGQADTFKKGPDWVCSYCGSLISQKDGKCTNCGVARDDSVRNYFDLKGKEQAPAADQPPADTGKKSWFSSKFVKIGGIAAVVIAGLLIWGFSTKEAVYLVNKVNWERVIPHERYAWSQKTDWEGEVKGDDVREISRIRDIRSYEKRQVGIRSEIYTESEQYQSGKKEECSTSYQSTGSGASKKVTKCKDVPVYSSRNVTRTRDVPVYRDFPVYASKITYRSKNFGIHETASQNGSDNSPRWPEIRLGTGVDSRPDREGQRVEKYTVSIRKSSDKGKGPREAIFTTGPLSFEKKYILNKEIPVKLNNFGSIIYDKDEKEVSTVK